MPVRQDIRTGTTTLLRSRFPLTVDTGDILYGNSGHGSILTRHPSWPGTSLVTSREYARLELINAAFVYQGAVALPTIAHFLINGNGNLSLSPHGNGSPDIGRPDECHGIKIFASGSRILWMKIIDVAGDAINLKTGGDPFASNILNQFDCDQSYVCNNFITHAFRGIVMQSPEAFVSGNTIAAIRDVAFLKTGTGGHSLQNHIFAAPIGIQVGTPILGAAGRFTDHEVESCGIAFLSYSPGTCINGFKSYLCTEACIDTYGQLNAVDLDLTVSAGHGVKIRQNCANSILQGSINCEDDTIGIEIPPPLYVGDYSDKLRFDLNITGGDKGLYIRQPISYSRMDLTLDQTVLDIASLGTSNKIDVVGNCSIINTSGSSLNATNKIYLNGDLLTL